MTSRQKLTSYFILLVTIWTAILFFFVTIYKTEVWFLDMNPFYFATIWGLYFLTIVYSHFCVTKKILLNIGMTTLIFIIIHPLDIKLVDSFTTYLIKLDKNQTILGWTFRFRWADIVLTNLFSLLILSLITKLLPTKWHYKCEELD
jgi:hypothetical protein